MFKEAELDRKIQDHIGKTLHGVATAKDWENYYHTLADRSRSMRPAWPKQNKVNQVKAKF